MSSHIIPREAIASGTQCQDSLPVVEVFHSVQGEGSWAGTNAFFIRLAGCNVGCSWCDTKESWNLHRYSYQPVDEVVLKAQTANPAIVVITGGEPLTHDLSSLTSHLHDAGLKVHLETSGAYPFSGNFDWVVFSPKQSRSPHPSVYSRVDELKIVVVNAADLERAEQEARKVPPAAVKYLQPEWNTPDSYNLIFEYVLQNPEWHISLQTHKFLGVR